MASPSKINLILSLSKDEAAPMVAAAMEQIRRAMSDSRFLHTLTVGEGGERSEPGEGVAAGTALTLPALAGWAPPSPAVRARGS